MIESFPLRTDAFGSPALPSTVDEALALGTLLDDRDAVPGRGRTRELWQLLAAVAAHDLGAARALEPHLDAMAIFEQAHDAKVMDAARDADRTWGVFAAEGGDDPLVATWNELGGEEGVPRWTVTGTKPWCSLAGRLDAALVTARTTEGERRLFAVELRDSGVTIEPNAWNARGLTEIPSGPVHFRDVLALPVGDPEWYLTRPGFTWGAIGVAACWYGGAVGIARTVYAAAAAKPNPFLLMHLGAIDALLASCALALADAARRVDAGEPTRVTAKRVRAIVAAAAEEIVERAGHALGPAPLALDAAHAKRVADLQLYVRQHHAEKDLASLGETLAADGDAPW